METYALMFVFCPGVVLLLGLALLIMFKGDVDRKS